MKEQKENLIIKEKGVNIMQDENKSVEVNEEVRNMDTNFNSTNVEKKKDTDLNYVGSVSTDGIKTSIPSTEIIPQEEFSNKCYRAFFGEDMEEDVDFGDDEACTEYNNMWDSIGEVYQELSEDNVVRIGTVLEPMVNKNSEDNIETLELPISVDDNGVIKKVKYTTYFPKNNKGFLYYEMLRLKKALLALGITESMIQGNKNPRNIARALQPLVGKKVKISQYKQEGYNKYEFHELVGGEN